MNYNEINDIDMNDNLWNRDVSSVIVLLKIHTPPQDNEWSNLNDMNKSVQNGDANIEGDS